VCEMLHFKLNFKRVLPVTAALEQNRIRYNTIQYNTEGQAPQ